MVASGVVALDGMATQDYDISNKRPTCQSCFKHLVHFIINLIVMVNLINGKC